METKESLMLSQDKKSKWLQRLDSIIDNGFIEEDDIYRKKSVAVTNDPHEHHDYDVVSTSEFVVSYIAGYVARKMQRFSRCHLCLASLESDKSSHRDRVIDLMSEQCIRPSNNLYSLIQQLENIVLTVVGTKTVRFDTMNHILDKVAEEKSLPFVGCQEHQFTLMKKILNYFITIRGHFLANHINKNYKQKSIKNKKLRKISKLV
ncbi:GSCOCG00012481001-RA-CDS [Cotesia congregata]|nr:GSCOCG00012481001-RA-CDS [Cotesia congregata]